MFLFVTTFKGSKFMRNLLMNLKKDRIEMGLHKKS